MDSVERGVLDSSIAEAKRALYLAEGEGNAAKATEATKHLTELVKRRQSLRS